MPYLDDYEKAWVEQYGAESRGQLNYAITTLVIKYWTKFGPKYSVANDIIGALEAAKLEFYRRIVAPYEQGKMEVNGDVYGTQQEGKDQSSTQ